jgi:metallo-beta-lactamase family protein
MKITIHGAGGGEVTGSAYLVHTSAANVLVDLGLFQGARKTENNNQLPKKGAFKKLDAVVLTHAHLDHTGRLPLLTRAGYNGPIYATTATFDIAGRFPFVLPCILLAASAGTPGKATCCVGSIP